mgnify:CR=1 FL=1
MKYTNLLRSGYCILLIAALCFQVNGSFQHSSRHLDSTSTNFIFIFKSVATTDICDCPEACRITCPSTKSTGTVVVIGVSAVFNLVFIGNLVRSLLKGGKGLQAAGGNRKIIENMQQNTVPKKEILRFEQHEISFDKQGSQVQMLDQSNLDRSVDPFANIQDAPIDDDHVGIGHNKIRNGKDTKAVGKRDMRMIGPDLDDSVKIEV